MTLSPTPVCLHRSPAPWSENTRSTGLRAPRICLRAVLDTARRARGWITRPWRGEQPEAAAGQAAVLEEVLSAAPPGARLPVAPVGAMAIVRETHEERVVEVAARLNGLPSAAFRSVNTFRSGDAAA